MPKQNNSTKIRKGEYNINPLFVKDGLQEQCQEKKFRMMTLWGFLKLLGGHLRLIITSLGGSYMP